MTGRPLRAVARLLLPLLLLPAAACTAVPFADEPRPVTVLGPWTDAQADAFEDLLAESGVRFDYQGTAAQREVLLSQVDAGAAPDLVVLPSPGELSEYAGQGRLERLTGLYDPEAYGAPWTAGQDHPYWLPVKVDVKSLVWRRERTPEPHAPVDAGQWCVGMRDPGASGWPGSDWIEDILLQQSGPEAYAKWAAGDIPWTRGPAARAWRTWRAYLRGEAAAEALRQDYRGAPGENGLLFAGRGEPSCTLEHQGSFARALYDERADEAVPGDSAPVLPGGPYALRGREVSGDFAALFRRTPQSERLLAFLLSKKGQESWPDRVPVLSARKDVSGGHEPGTVSAGLLGRLRDTGVPLCLDASDVMLPTMRDAFHEKVLLQLSLPDRDPDEVLGRLEELRLSLGRQGQRTVRHEQVCS
ncbi:extracellular solute-binding protein [Streptomyces sp. NPDC050504]|uniref:extracellular solute-binding protein n=1 Tax=Streptomyces sp. NPDC050504 TaxID=3365618 RepID=UPI0037972D5D